MVLRILVALLLVAPPAFASGWPQPAMGESASGDVEIIFTFDDGPNPVTTPEVLDILAAHHIKAVFFLVGKQVVNENKAVPKIIERILAEGHVIANHTWGHADLCRLKDEDKAVREIDQGKAVIERVAGIPVAWFRAPYGVRCERVERLLAERHLTHFHWDLDPQEWRGGGPDKVFKYVTGMLAHAHGRDVLLLHDVKQVTVKALPLILAWIDEENAKRARSHKHMIRFLPAPQLALEKLQPGLKDWFLDATADLRGLPEMIAKALPASVR